MKHDNFEGRETRVNTVSFDLDIIEGDTVLAAGARRENSFCQQYSSMFENVSFGK